MTSIKDLEKLHADLKHDIKEAEKVVSFISDKIFELRNKRNGQSTSH